MLNFQGFWGIFEGFSQKAEKGNCKFEPKNGILCLNVILANKFDCLAEAFSLNTAPRFLRGERKRQAFLLTACSYLFDNFGLRYKVHDCYRYDSTIGDKRLLAAYCTIN